MGADAKGVTSYLMLTVRQLKPDKAIQILMDAEVPPI